MIGVIANLYEKHFNFNYLFDMALEKQILFHEEDLRKHLRVLKNEKIIKEWFEGGRIVYSLIPPVKAINALLDDKFI